MTTFVDFVPTTRAPFQFQAMLDGQSYNVIVTWSLQGLRYYVNVFALDGTRILTRAMVGSTTGIPIEAISWAANKVTVRTTDPHGFRVGRVTTLTVSGVTPVAYNGTVEILATDDDAFTYPLAADPGAATVLGSVSYDINLVGGLFASSLVFRAPNNQFEIAP